MPSEGWITVPGKGKRYRMGDGSYRLTPPPPGYEAIKGLLGPMAAGATAGGLGIWSAPARAQEPPAAGSSGSRIPDSSDLLNSRVNNRDPRFAPGPGQGAPAPVVRPAARARDEALNAASQQGGGPNLSQPLVPDDAIAASKQFATARESDPFAAVPELIDQRSQAYEQRADIQAWAKANPELAKRLFAKQRKADPGPMEATPAGVAESYGQDLNVGPGAAGLEQIAYQGGIPTPEKAALQRGFTEEVEGAPQFDLKALAYEGPAPVPQAAPLRSSQEGLSAAFSGELDVAPQGTAQQSNLNFNNSPLPDANLAQSFTDQKKKALLEKYLPQAASFNTVWRG